MENAPPRDQICGTWKINNTRSTWPENNAELSGEIELKPDGTFNVLELPNFWDFPGMSSDLKKHHKTASGKWYIEERMKDYPANVQLWIVNVDGKEQKKVQQMFFVSEWNYFLLYIIIGDPDSNEHLVFSKKK